MAKGPGARHNIYYFDDNANFNAMRWNDWKIHFAWMMEGGPGRERHSISRGLSTCAAIPTKPLSTPDSTRAFADQLWLFVPTQQEVGKWLMTFREFPPRQATASFYHRPHDATDAANAADARHGWDRVGKPPQ